MKLMLILLVVVIASAMSAPQFDNPQFNIFNTGTSGNSGEPVNRFGSFPGASPQKPIKHNCHWHLGQFIEKQAAVMSLHSNSGFGSAGDNQPNVPCEIAQHYVAGPPPSNAAPF